MSDLPMTFTRIVTLAEWKPFITPMPVWDYWYLLALPLVIGVAIIYKIIKVDSIQELPKAALATTLWILIGMVVVAGMLVGIVEVAKK